VQAVGYIGFIPQRLVDGEAVAGIANGGFGPALMTGKKA